MTDEEKMNWVRNHWSSLKKRGKLEEALEKIKLTNRNLDNYLVKDIIDMEESLPEYLK